ncbi:MAG: uncharacterized protein KVP18_001153 [Porospora cf. gigantea A]|nr:MAG: hypothetical protein KVP18_001153 [Porospora cf. gigantea A]
MPVVTSRDPTNIRDASSGSHPPMTPPTFGSRSHNPFLNRATAAQPPNVDEEHHCNVCSRSFHSERGLEAHIEAEHVPCDEEGCSFTAPARYMIFHAMKHVRDRQGRLPDDPEVVNEWIARRRARFPGSKKKEKGAGPLPMFESMLKKGAGTAHGLNIRGSSAFIPSMSGVLRREREIHDNVFETVPNNNMPVPARRQRMQGLLESYLNKAAVMQGKRSIPHYLLREPFKICERVLSKKDCKFGADCKQSHDLAAYYRYLDLRHQANLDIHMRPPLIYRLVKDDVCEYETKLLMAIRFLVKSGFLKV